MRMGVGLERPLLTNPPRVGAGPACKCLAWHLPESHSEGKGGHGNHWLPPFCLRIHTLQVVQFRDTRALKSLLDSLPQFSYALRAWRAHAGGCPLKFPGSQAGLLLVFSSGLACSVRRGLLGAIPEQGGSLAGGPGTGCCGAGKPGWQRCPRG